MSDISLLKQIFMLENSVYREIMMKTSSETMQVEVKEENVNLPQTPHTQNKPLQHKKHSSYFQYLLKKPCAIFNIFKPWHLETLKKVIPHKVYAQVHADTAQIFAEAVVGIQHRQAHIQLPCQDAVQATLKPRPILILCDGAGSAAVSDIGAYALTSQLLRLSQTLEPLLKDILDLKESPDVKVFVRLFIRHAMGILQDCAKNHRRPIKDFRSTLNLVIMGKVNSLWIKVGDGEIIQEKIYKQSNQEEIHIEYECLGTNHKGEFANQTQFIDAGLVFEDVHWGLFNSQTTTGVALMSDGAAEKLVSTTQKNQVAAQVSHWLQQVRSQKFKVKDFYHRIYSDEFLSRSTGDDRTIALYSCQYAIEV